MKWTGATERGGSFLTGKLFKVEAHYSVVGGQTLSIQVPPDTKAILPARRRARARGTRRGGEPSTVLPLPADGQFKWTAPGTGTWEITFVRHVYRSSPTRFGQREDGTRDKDSLYSLIDYLDPAGHRHLSSSSFRKPTRKSSGDEFGKTILGFRGDETDYTGFMPWTPKLLDTFQKQKGYDLKPYIAQFFASR